MSLIICVSRLGLHPEEGVRAPEKRLIFALLKTFFRFSDRTPSAIPVPVGDRGTTVRYALMTCPGKSGTGYAALPSWGMLRSRGQSPRERQGFSMSSPAPFCFPGGCIRPQEGRSKGAAPSPASAPRPPAPPCCDSLPDAQLPGGLVDRQRALHTRCLPFTTRAGSR